MKRNMTFHRKKVWLVMIVCTLMLLGLIGRLAYLMIGKYEYYSVRAENLHERERSIKGERGKILDRNGNVLAANKTVCTVSVIHNQIKEPEKVIRVLSNVLGISEDTIRKKVEKVSSIEKIKANVDKEIGDIIREYNLSGVKVDEDYKRYYPYGSLASKVLGFTGAENQGIIGLEVKYDDILEGENGTIYTVTDARGVELEYFGERREEPAAGNTLRLSLDINIQQYAEQAAEKVTEEKDAERVSILVMNPQNGEIYACVNVPEFDLNAPYTLTEWMTNEETEETLSKTESAEKELTEQEEQDLLNQMWRNPCLNDTYEPGSTFKIITMAAALEEGVVSPDSTFYCPGYIVVEDRRIHCARRIGHGSQNFVQGTQNSCNPVFIDVGLRLGVDKYYEYFQKFGLLKKTGIDLPGEAGTIMHQKENMGSVELATVAFGQSFQITPIQLVTTVSSLINGGNRITPHFGVSVQDQDGSFVEKIQYPVEENIVSEEVSKTIRKILETVVSEGGGKNAIVEGYSVGGKTATSQTLPRSANRYISSFLGFAPAENPQVLALCIIHDPKGIYYGGTIAAPVVQDIFENILPYMGIEKIEKEEITGLD